MPEDKNAFDLSKFPLVASTLEPAPRAEVRGEYDESTETWSHRAMPEATPKKNNEES